MRAKLLALPLLVGCVISTTADGQVIAIASNLLSKVENVAVYPMLPVGLATASKGIAESGLGLEFSFGIGRYSRPMDLSRRQSRCAKITAGGERCDPASTRDTVLTLSTIRRPTDDSTFQVAIKPIEYTIFDFSLTVASRLTPIHSDQIVPGWELRGKIQEFPTLTFYTGLFPDNWVSPYFGVTVVPGELKNVKVVQGDSAATIDASEIGYGVSLGLAFLPRIKGREIKNLSVFTELDYTDLHFNTTGWKRPQNLPAGSLPSRIALQGLRLLVGAEFALKGD